MMNRKFITGDLNPVACQVIMNRLKKAGIENFKFIDKKNA